MCARIQQRRERLAAAREAMQGIDAELWAVSCGGGLGELLNEVDALGSSCEAARVAIVVEAMGRGDTGDGPRALTITQWVRQHAPSTRSGGAGQIVTVAHAFTKAANAPVREAVRAGSLPVRAAAVVVAEADRLRPLLAEGAEPHVLGGRRGRHVEPPRFSARVPDAAPGPAREVRPRRAAPVMPGRWAPLHRPVPAPRRWGRVVRVPPGSRRRGQGSPRGRPRPAVRPGTRGRRAGPPDLGPAPWRGPRRARAASRRRGGVGADEPEGPNLRHHRLGVPPRAVRGGGTTLGGSDTGTLLGPETVRRLACNASILPLVLGTDGEIVDQGRQHRPFTPAQIRRLWLRDGGCTYPGCSMPPHWADAHHVVHWADFGPTDLGNAALLCQRHHTLVHTRRLAGAVVKDPTSTRAGTSAGTGAGHAGRVGPHPRQLRPAVGEARRAGASVIPPRTPPAVSGVVSSPRRRGLAAGPVASLTRFRQSTFVPYISPSGSAISSSRAPSGSRK